MLKYLGFKGWIFALLLFLLLPALGCAGFIKEQNLPEIKKDCSSCHPAEVKKGPVLLNKPLSDLCLDCHATRKGAAEHRVDVVPAMAVQKLPLSNGKMTCVTCHDPHKNKYGKMLRVKAKDLCSACHKY